ncbi:hypothetical protein GCM10011608_22570 [Micromonospora sonchi]|uniref:Beta-lactamase-related domain-containing protein n=1 Tax=Micromonospora sonchi TaxID=1763543 RepID=A0A917TTH6_9ACTN|nr:hypothetical protein GCM10011608_22570 [Micromonospora sonchi]
MPYSYLTASLDDLTRFATTQLAGGRYGDTTLLSADTTQRMQTGQVSTGGSGRYGLGWRETTLTGPDARIVWHAGATPGYFSHLVLVPETRIGVVVLANAYSLAMDPLLVSAAFNIARVLHAAPTVEAEPDPLLTGGLVGLVGLAALLVVALAWAVVRVVRRRRSGAARCRREIVRTVGWVVGCGGLAATVVWGVPALQGADGLGQVSLWMPDAAQVIGGVAGLAAMVALTRLAGLALAPRRSTPDR